MVEHSKAKRIAEELRAVHEAKLQAEADELRLVCELAECYRLGLPDSPEHEPLYEAELQLGNDFTPPISEFFPLELAGLLGIPRAQASFLTGQALDLKYRHITLWNAVLDGRVEPRRALTVAGRSGLLSLKLIELATWRWTKQQKGLSHRAAINAWDRIVAELDPELAARREQQQLDARYVHIGRYRDGALQLSGQLDILDGRYLDAAIDQLADILPHHDPDLAGMDKKTRRAKALGALAHPAYALALLQRAAQQPLTDPPPPVQAVGGEVDNINLTHKRDLSPAPLDPPQERGDSARAGYRRFEQHGCLGHTCGQITVPLHKLRPKPTVVLHLNAADITAEGGAVGRAEQAGHLTATTITALLADQQVTIQPVIDLPELPDEDQYRPSTRMREAVTHTFPVDWFLYDNRTSRGLQIDHNVPYTPTGPPGQTRLANLTPLSTGHNVGRSWGFRSLDPVRRSQGMINQRFPKVHRAKTARHWHLQRVDHLTVIWTSPLGYRYKVGRHGTRRLTTRGEPPAR